MSRRLNEIEDGMIRELMELAFEAGEIAIEVAERKDDELADKALDTMQDFRRRFGMLCYHGRRRSKACREAFQEIVKEARSVPDEEMAQRLGITVEELKELHNQKDIELVKRLFDVA